MKTNRNWLWRRVALVVSLLLISSLVLAACGDDDDDDDDATSPAAAATNTTGSGSTTTTSDPTATTDQADPSPTEGDEPAGDLSGEINIDGSSTVFPITQAVAEEFNRENNDVEITVGQSGTGGGFEKFCAGDTAIQDASRPIDEDEIALCEAAGIEYVELPVGIDGLTVVVNAENDWVDCITVEQLNQIWMAESTVENWSDVDPSWPDEAINLYGPGTDSGTFDYFTEEINGEGGNSRADYTASEDDNVLVQGVAGDEHALGYFGYAYYVENSDSLKALAIDNGSGCVEPNEETVQSNEYAPLSRPLLIYVNVQALTEEPQVAAFVDYYLTDGVALVSEVGYVPYDDAQYQENLAAVEAATQ